MRKSSWLSYPLLTVSSLQNTPCRACRFFRWEWPWRAEWLRNKKLRQSACWCISGSWDILRILCCRGIPSFQDWHRPGCLRLAETPWNGRAGPALRMSNWKQLVCTILFYWAIYCGGVCCRGSGLGRAHRFGCNSLPLAIRNTRYLPLWSSVFPGLEVLFIIWGFAQRHLHSFLWRQHCRCILPFARFSIICRWIKRESCRRGQAICVFKARHSAVWSWTKLAL